MVAAKRLRSYQRHRITPLHFDPVKWHFETLNIRSYAEIAVFLYVGGADHKVSNNSSGGSLARYWKCTRETRYDSSAQPADQLSHSFLEYTNNLIIIPICIDLQLCFRSWWVQKPYRLSKKKMKYACPFQIVIDFIVKCHESMCNVLWQINCHGPSILL